MKIISCKTADEVTRRTAEELRGFHHELGHPLRLFVPTGRTPLPLYAKFRDEKTFWAGVLRPIQVDEFLDSQRVFYNEIKREVLAPLGIENKAEVLDPHWTEDQMKEHVERVLSKPVDVALLGLGLNGHVGFHEPGPGLDFRGGKLRVTDESRRATPEATTNDVYTFGAGAFMKAKKIIVMVTGEKKRAILEAVIKNAPTPQIPATLLKGHSDFSIITDISV